MIDVLDIDHKEHAKEISSADFHTYGIHTKCFVTCQIPDNYYNNYLMHFIKEDDRKIQARKKTACERAFSFVNSELKAMYKKNLQKNLSMNVMIKEMKLIIIKMRMILILLNQMHMISILGEDWIFF